MIKFIPSTQQDVDQIREWAIADPFHQNQKNADWWLTGSVGFFSCCVQDEIGPVVYLKVEEAEQFILHCQFGPRSEVSCRRLLMAMNEGLPPILFYLLSKGKNIVFNSSNPSLVKFMVSRGFRPGTPGVTGEYILKCEV